MWKIKVANSPLTLIPTMLASSMNDELYILPPPLREGQTAPSPPSAQFQDYTSRGLPHTPIRSTHSVNPAIGACSPSSGCKRISTPPPLLSTATKATSLPPPHIYDPPRTFLPVEDSKSVSGLPTGLDNFYFFSSRGCTRQTVSSCTRTTYLRSPFPPCTLPPCCRAVRLNRLVSSFLFPFPFPFSFPFLVDVWGFARRCSDLVES